MSLAVIVSLLQTALVLLTLVSGHPELPQSVRDTATLVAQQAITQATSQLTETTVDPSSWPVCANSPAYTAKCANGTTWTPNYQNRCRSLICAPIAKECPVFNRPECKDGTLVSLGTDANGCSKGFHCVVKKESGCYSTGTFYPEGYTTTHIVNSDGTISTVFDATYVCRGGSWKIEPLSGSQTFSATPTSGAAPLSIDFLSWIGGNRPPTDSYTIEYGDGTSESAASCYAPADVCLKPGRNRHIYEKGGVYTARLVKVQHDDCAGNPRCKASPQRTELGSVPITVTAAPAAGLISAINGPETLVIGEQGKWVVRTSKTVVSTAISWGDGTRDDRADALPETNGFWETTFRHVFSAPRTYTVIVTVSDAKTSESKERNVAVHSGVPAFEPTTSSRVTFFSVFYDNESTLENQTKIQFGTQGVKQCDLIKANVAGGDNALLQFSTGQYAVIQSNIGVGGEFGTPQSVVTVPYTDAVMLVAAKCVGDNGATIISSPVYLHRTVSKY